ncbi:MAG: hypothetical protein K2O18_17115 [Oscillospiraceae bacterium]|nr:hypothetical protein [Oscillospiraceae bacterium]
MQALYLYLGKIAGPLTVYSLWFLLLMVYSFLGWCCEMVYCSLCEGHLCEKRGFLNGPVCPVYGHGALLVLIILRGGCETPLLTFLYGAVLTSVIEYITSYYMEKLFHMRWWDYSGRRFNLFGRVCLRNSALFGAACVVLCHILAQGVMQWAVLLIRDGIGIPLALVLTILYGGDIIVSVRSAYRIGERLVKLHAIHDELAAKLEELKAAHEQAMAAQKERVEEFVYAARQSAAEKRAEAAEDIQAKLERIKGEQERVKESHRRLLAAVEAEAQDRMRRLYERSGYFERRLLRSFPALHSPRHGEALKKLREYLEDRREK